MIMEQHLGVVMANDTDPEKRGGINVRVDTLLSDFEYPDLFYPIFPPNMFKVPETGEIVEVIVIGDIDESDPSDDGDLGTVEFSDYCFWTGKIFDTTKGIIPKELQKNYPKRSGMFWHDDGTIVYYDATKGAKEFTISLTDKKTLIQLKEDSVTLQQDQVKLEMKSGKVIITNSFTELGAAGATQPILLGNIIYDAFFHAVSGLATNWLTAATTLATGADPSGATSAAYGGALVTALNTFIATGTAWKSGKHKVDS